MAKKPIKVSQIVYDFLENKKKGNESFDDVLRRLHDLGPDISDLAAYLSEEQRELATTFVNFIEGLADFEKEIVEDTPYDNLNFVSKESNLTIIQLGFTEEKVRVRYRNKEGDLSFLFSIQEGDFADYDAEKKTEWVNNAKERINKKVDGALRKWG